MSLLLQIEKKVLIVEKPYVFKKGVLLPMKLQDSAVSPVVGVMLMLAVTIMIAAIVSATAGSFSNTEKKAPSAILDVSIYAAKDYGGYYAPTMTIRHISGNVLQTKDLQIVTYYTVPRTGNISRGSLLGETSVNGISGWDPFSDTARCGILFINDENRLERIPFSPLQKVMRTGTGMHQPHSARVTSW